MKSNVVYALPIYVIFVNVLCYSNQCTMPIFLMSYMHCLYMKYSIVWLVASLVKVIVRLCVQQDISMALSANLACTETIKECELIEVNMNCYYIFCVKLLGKV